MPGLTVPGSPRIGAARQSVTAMTPALRPDRGKVDRQAAARKPGGMIREPAAAEAGEPQVIYSVCNNPGGA